MHASNGHETQHIANCKACMHEITVQRYLIQVDLECANAKFIQH
jgi:hypothetical protein